MERIFLVKKCHSPTVGGEAIPFVQGKEQRLLFAGAAKRYHMSEVRET